MKSRRLVVAGFGLACAWAQAGCEIPSGSDLTATGDSGPPAREQGGSSGSGGMAAGGGVGRAAGGTSGSGGQPGAAGEGGDDPFAAYRQACVDKINAFRATEGKAPLARWTVAEACSDGEAKSDSGTKTAHGAFGMCKESAQDECPGWPNDPNKIINGCLQDMWDEGPGMPYSEHGHYLNMSSTKYKKVACGFFMTPDRKIWAVQDFRP